MVSMQSRSRRGIISLSIGGILLFLLIILQVTSSADTGGEQVEESVNEIEISPPGYIPLRSPFMIFIGLNFSDSVQLKASLSSQNGKYASRLWNGTQWVYPGGSWDTMLPVPGNFSGFIYLQPYENYVGWSELLDQQNASIDVSVKKKDSGDIEKRSITADLLDYESSEALCGYSISGRVYHKGSPLENGFLTLTPHIKGTDIEGHENSSSYYTTEPNMIEDGNDLLKGYFQLWAIAGDNTLNVYSNENMMTLLHSENLTISSHTSLDLGEYRAPFGVCINEVHYDPVGNEAEGEFVELFNFLNTTIELNGWSLSDQDGDPDHIFPDTEISSLSYCVLHTSPGDDHVKDGVHHFYLGKTASYLTNTGDDLVLRSLDGTPVDYVAWGNSSSVDPPPQGLSWTGSMISVEGSSLSLVPDGADTNSSATWQQTVPTPGSENECNENNSDQKGGTIQIIGPHHIMITEIYYNTYGGGDQEYFSILNQANEAVNLTGWKVTDGESDLYLPGLTLGVAEKIFFSRDPTIFYHLTSIDSEYTSSLSLGDTKDSLSLLDPIGNIVDAVSWGGDVISGCNGSLDSSRTGQVMKRRRNDGLFLDTNSVVDWESNRIFMVGQSEFPFTRINFSGNVTAFVSPDSSYGAIRSELKNATDCIHLNLYEFTNLDLCSELCEALNRGVQVNVLLEGAPVGGITETELYIAHQLTQAGANIRFIHNNDTVKDRYNYDHAKYAIIDHDTLVLDSENWKPSGIPVDPTYGNRGWGIIIRDTHVAGYFRTVFYYDSNHVFSDIVEFGVPPYIPPSNFTNNYTISSGPYFPRFNERTIIGDFEVFPVLAPDHTLNNDSILSMIRNANVSVYVEQLQCQISWGTELPDLYLEAAIRAAERGCDVRILLDSRYVNIMDGTLDNWDTVNYINGIAIYLGLPNLKAKLMILKGLTKLHNKGIIVDGMYTLISSINWGKGAALMNREAGVIIKNEDVASYFTQVFLDDWHQIEEVTEHDGEKMISQAYLTGALVILAGVATGLLARKKRRTHWHSGSWRGSNRC